MLKIKEIDQNDIDLVIDLLEAMQNELQEFDFNSTLFKDVILRDISNGVKWFLFKENDIVIGTCHMQHLHNYWRIEKRYYLGGFYLQPEYRAKGYFKKIYNLLKSWAKDHEGVQIYCHIHENNDKSLGAFTSVGMEKVGYRLMVDHWGDD